MTFLYCAVANKSSIVASGPDVNVSFNAMLMKLVKMIKEDKYHQINQKEYVIRILADSGMFFICVCESTTAANTQTSFLQELQRKWNAKYGNEGQNFTEGSKTKDFQPEMESILSTFTSERGRKIAAIKSNIALAQETMITNLEEAINRGDKLEEMEEKASSIEQNAQVFQKASTKVANKMFWEKYRWFILGGIVAVIVIIIIVLIAVYA